eukprot:9482540-Pyramimonas_sp.AAC.1
MSGAPYSCGSLLRQAAVKASLAVLQRALLKDLEASLQVATHWTMCVLKRRQLGNRGSRMALLSAGKS